MRPVESNESKWISISIVFVHDESDKKDIQRLGKSALVEDG